ncbi:hypothetical protein J4E91_003106 [Alternaria rosae]|nr:hypothetical protein J4E91_003106 [Alternaria rosae]
MHRHSHAHDPVKRGTIFAPAAIETHIVYWLDDHSIAEEEAREGIANGILMWGNDGVLSTSTSSPVALPTLPSVSKQQVPAANPTQEPTPKMAAEYPEPVAPGPQKPAPSPEMPPSVPTPSLTQDTTPIQQSGTPRPWIEMVDKDGHCAECDKEFPNGKIRCTEFPYGYGALPIAHEGLGGWSGIQDPQYSGGDGFDDITTVPKGSCSDGTCCTSGSFCSYGCPNPYLKASFPSIQGTESMTFPVTVGPGETGFLANPDQQKYFFWQGKKTSAQYYVNKQGVPEDEACTWGTAMGGKGNWAPAVFGTSFDGGPMQEGFSSLKQNELCKKERLGYDITFIGDGVVSPCRYKSATNQWCQADKCWEDPDRGCTAAIVHGDLTVVLSDG